MILPNYLLEEVRKFCNILDIPFRNNNVPQKHQRLIEDFVRARLKKDRWATRKIEGLDALKINRQIDKIKSGMIIEESPIEVYLKQGMERAGLYEYCKPQYQIGKKRVDFAFPEARLVVECDGREYHHTDQSQIERDQERDKYLARKGWRVLHIEGLAIRRNITLCIDKIKKALGPALIKDTVGKMR